MRALAFALCVAAAASGAADSYEASVESWRRQREESLKAKDGWLSVAGLFWLKEGENRVGSDPSFEVVLPEGRSPRRVGVVDFDRGTTRFRVATGAHVLANGKPTVTAELKPDSKDLLQFGDFSISVIQRGPRYGLRLRDVRSAMRRHFRGLRWYPVQAGYRVEAKFVAYPAPRTIAVPNILGQIERQPSPGYALFHLAGKTCRLDPVLEGDRLFFIFSDRTAGRATYGAGRFLYSDPPKDGKVVLDFNKAHNPPCAFTPYATCPLPPKGNRLAIAVEAGEMKYGEH